MKKLKFFLSIIAITGLAIAIPAKRLSIGSPERAEDVVSRAEMVIRASGPKEPMYTLPKALGLGTEHRSPVILEALDSLLEAQCNELGRLSERKLCSTGLANTIQGKVSALSTNNQAINEARYAMGQQEEVQQEVQRLVLVRELNKIISDARSVMGQQEEVQRLVLVKKYNKNILAMRSLRCTSAFIKTGKEEYAVRIGNALQQLVISLKRMSAPLQVFLEEPLDLRKPKTRVRKIVNYQSTLDKYLARITELHEAADWLRAKISRREPFSQQDSKALQSIIIDQEEVLGLEVPESLLPEVLVRDVLSNDYELVKQIAAIKVPKIF